MDTDNAIDEIVDWYCSEPRLSFNRTVVLRYRIHLEARNLAPGTINLRLGAVRRLAYEAAECGLLSPDLAAGIRPVKGVKNLRELRIVKGSLIFPFHPGIAYSSLKLRSGRKSSTHLSSFRSKTYTPASVE